MAITGSPITSATPPMTDDMAQAFRNAQPLALIVDMTHPSGSGDDGHVRLWTGIGPLSWNGFLWTGAGRLLSIDPMESSIDLTIQDVQLSLAGVDPEKVALISDNIRNYTATAWLASLNLRGNVVRDPYLLRIITLDYQTLSAEENGTVTISVIGHTCFYSLERALDEVWSPENQKKIYPTDVGLDMINALQNQDVQWTPT